jgi:uncharacterized membrane protein (UPF0127 family)
MQEVIIHNLDQPQISTIKAFYCSSFPCRLRGLTFRRSLNPDLGLLLVQSRETRLDAAIHMLFVWIDLAVIWINSSEEVVDVRLARSWRPVYLPRRSASYVLELNAARLNDFNVGDRIEIEKILD